MNLNYGNVVKDESRIVKFIITKLQNRSFLKQLIKLLRQAADVFMSLHCKDSSKYRTILMLQTV